MKKRHYFLIAPLLILFLFWLSCDPAKQAPVEENTAQKVSDVKLIPMIDYSLVKAYPHDVNSFTEGFLFHNNKLLESTGAPGNLPQTKSLFGELDLTTGQLTKKAELDKTLYFGEGIVVVNNYLYQLTYTNQIGFIYDAKTYERKGQFGYVSKQGWGMTTDGKNIIMSDGTNAITYLNPSDFSISKTLSVTENGFALDFINELEWINGFIYANVWMTNFIVKIDPESGDVVGKLDLTELANQAKKININLAEMNGIAYDSLTNRILVTGKLWPSVYEIKFNH
jgi:glutaminyl-peptide cyclotransferase